MIIGSNKQSGLQSQPSLLQGLDLLKRPTRTFWKDRSGPSKQWGDFGMCSNVIAAPQIHSSQPWLEPEYEFLGNLIRSPRQTRLSRRMPFTKTRCYKWLGHLESGVIILFKLKATWTSYRLVQTVWSKKQDLLHGLVLFLDADWWVRSFLWTGPSSPWRPWSGEPLFSLVPVLVPVLKISSTKFLCPLHLSLF